MKIIDKIMETRNEKNLYYILAKTLVNHDLRIDQINGILTDLKLPEIYLIEAMKIIKEKEDQDREEKRKIYEFKRSGYHFPP